MSLLQKYDALKREAEALAGGVLEIPRRVLVLLDLYRHSGGNHTFPLIAAHGALWASTYFESGGSVGRLIAKRYFYSAQERIDRLGILQRFAEDFRRINRQVCIDTWTNYRFVELHGHESGAEKLIPSDLLAALNDIHAARQSSQSLSDDERRRVFEKSFHCEQEVTVAPGVQAAVAAFDCPIMQFICLHPIVRFSYFPACRYLMFRNFAQKDERIRKGMRAWDIARSAGWTHVEQSLALYGMMPPQQLTEPTKHLAEIREEMRRHADALTPRSS